MTPKFDEASILAIERPDKALWTYYLLRCLLVPPLLPIVILPAWFRYHTMRYRFTDEGISMTWGILFRREVILNYARIQDIHLRSNLVERWFGLARIQVQTASGSAAAEITIEGLKQFEAVRDFLYSKMRGVKDAGQHRSTSAALAAGRPMDLDAATSSELAGVLREVADELRRLREALERTPRHEPEGGTMFERLRAVLLSVLRVPPEPEPPFGAPGSVRVFRAGRNYYRLRLLGWGIRQLGALVGIVFSLWFLHRVESGLVEFQHRQALATQSAPATAVTVSSTPSTQASEGTRQAWNKLRVAQERFSRAAATWPNWVLPLLSVVEFLGLGGFAVQAFLTYVAVRLDFELRWYMVTDRSLRIRRGVWSVQEITMSFANLQQVVVSQGPVQRLLGIADVRVESAGGGKSVHDPHETTTESMHTGIFHGVDHATEVRDLILARLRCFRETGLGDPDEAQHPPPPPPSGPAQSEVLAAAHGLLTEACALRAALGSR